MAPDTSPKFHVGLIGAGIGGLTAAVSLARHGKESIKVTVLEAASELGEIGAGIQMTPNVAQLLIRWGVSDVIGDNLVEFDELNMRSKDGTVVGHSEMLARKWCGIPWWLVHRMHLHDGLATVAKRLGVEMVIKAKVNEINYQNGPKVQVKTEAGGSWEFDCVIGSDGINSIVRRVLLPDIKPTPPTGNAAYRAIVPMETVRNDPLTKSLIEKNSMDIWCSSKKGKQHGYVITYQISGGKDFNIVLSHHRDYFVEGVEDVDMDEVKETYKDYDPRIRRVIELIPDPVRRWPLMVTRCPTWSSTQKNVVLMGDAAHSMVNHMAQGAATSMEDGAFLGVVLGAVAQKELDLRSAIDLYEKERMPLADVKQQVSYLNGLIYHMEDDTPQQKARDEALAKEMRGEVVMRSPNLYTDPWTWRTIYEYDAENHAIKAMKKVMEGGDRDRTTHVTKEQEDIFLGWFMPENKSQANL